MADEAIRGRAGGGFGVFADAVRMLERARTFAVPRWLGITIHRKARRLFASWRRGAGAWRDCVVSGAAGGKRGGGVGAEPHPDTGRAGRADPRSAAAQTDSIAAPATAAGRTRVPDLRGEDEKADGAARQMGGAAIPWLHRLSAVPGDTLYRAGLDWRAARLRPKCWAAAMSTTKSANPNSAL